MKETHKEKRPVLLKLSASRPWRWEISDAEVGPGGLSESSPTLAEAMALCRRKGWTVANPEDFTQYHQNYLP
jgi:hypothetical protein